MPKIPVYQSDVPAPRPDNSLPEVFARGGEVIGETIKGVGNQLQDIQNRQEISDMTANLAKTRADLEIQWQQKLREADPNDPNFKNLAQDFMDNVAGPALDKVGERVSTREATLAYNQASAVTKADMLRTAVEGQTSLQGEFAVSRVAILGNELGGQVFRNPTFFDSALLMQRLAVQGAVHNSGLPQSKAIELEQQFGKNLAIEAFTGAAAQPGGLAAVEKMVDDPKFDPWLSRADRFQMLRDAQRQNSFQQSMDRENQRAQSEAAVRSYESRMKFNPDGSFSFSDANGQPQSKADWVNDALHDQNLKHGEVSSIISMGERLAAQGDKASSSHLMQDFMQRLSLDAKDPNYPTQKEVMDHVGMEGGLSKSDAQFLMRRMTGKTPLSRAENKIIAETERAARASIAPNIGGLGTDPQSEEQMQRFDAWFYTALDQGIAQGHDVTRELLNPDSPNYLLGKNNAVLSRFGGTMDNGFSAQMKQIQQESGTSTTQSKPSVPISAFMNGLLGGKK